MASRTLFYRSARGQDAQSVDSWFLILRDDCWIEHAWSHGDGPDKSVETETLTPSQVMATVEDMALLGCLRATLASDALLRSQKTI